MLLVIALAALVSCGNDHDCVPAESEVKTLESEYGCSDTRYGLHIGLTNDFMVIRSGQDFANKVTGNCSPQINFSSYDLIIGKKGLSSGNASIDYKLIKDCSNGLRLQVTFNQNATLIAPNITYHALIPKLGDQETLNVEFIYINK